MSHRGRCPIINAINLKQLIQNIQLLESDHVVYLLTVLNPGRTIKIIVIARNFCKFHLYSGVWKNVIDGAIVVKQIIVFVIFGHTLAKANAILFFVPRKACARARDVKCNIVFFLWLDRRNDALAYVSELRQTQATLIMDVIRGTLTL